MTNHPNRRRWSAIRVAPGLDNEALAKRVSLEDAVAAAVRFGARYDDNAIEALEQGRSASGHACLQYGQHPDEYVRIERAL